MLAFLGIFFFCLCLLVLPNRWLLQWDVRGIDEAGGDWSTQSCVSFSSPQTSAFFSLPFSFFLCLFSIWCTRFLGKSPWILSFCDWKFLFPGFFIFKNLAFFTHSYLPRYLGHVQWVSFFLSLRIVIILKSISCYCHIFIFLGLMNLLLISYKTCFGIFIWKLILNWSSVCLRVHFPSLGSPHCDQRFCRGVHQAHWVSE